MKRLPPATLLPAALLAALAAIVLGWISGPSDAGFASLVALLTGRADDATRSILVDIRLSRVLLAALVGAALSGAGTAFQAVLRNPLADPYILGVSGGAALGAALVGVSSSVTVAAGRPLAAFAGAVLTLLLLFRLARVRGRTGSVTLLLAGVMLNAIDSAIILFLMTTGDPSRFQGVLFYLVGSVGSVPWPWLAAAALPTVAGLVLLGAFSHRLNVMTLGEEEAGHLGLDVEKTTWTVVVAASLVTAAAVAFTGLVGFVGLVVPHACRSVVGPDHRVLLPAAVIAGAGFVVLADTLARTAMAPLELPVGVITALVGGPMFLVLFLRRYREGERP